MPDTDLAKAALVGERLRQCIATAPFRNERLGDRGHGERRRGGARISKTVNDPPIERDGRNRVVPTATNFALVPGESAWARPVDGPSVLSSKG